MTLNRGPKLMPWQIVLVILKKRGRAPKQFVYKIVFKIYRYFLLIKAISYSDKCAHEFVKKSENRWKSSIQIQRISNRFFCRKTIFLLTYFCVHSFLWRLICYGGMFIKKKTYSTHRGLEKNANILIRFFGVYSHGVRTLRDAPLLGKHPLVFTVRS